MIVVRITSGLGNQLFMYSMGRCLAEKLQTTLKLDISLSQAYSHHSFYRLSEFNIIENFATPEEIKDMKVLDAAEMHGKLEFSPEFLNSADNSYLQGQWRDVEHMNEYREILLKEFTLKNPLHKNSAEWKKQILSVKNSISIHVRHGDYMRPDFRKRFGIIPLVYYQECVKILKKLFSNMTLFVFSDDIEWAKSRFHFGVPIKFVEGCETDIEEFYLMSLCKHNVIANSTFSRWAAWLNQNPNKKIFVPRTTLYKEKYLTNVDMFPQNSQTAIKVPLDCKKVELPPFYSIIMFIENDGANLSDVLPSLLNQQFKSYEIILVDSSGSNIRKENFIDFDFDYVDVDKITVINVSKDTKKIEGWNKGLDKACGEYVLFLTNKNFLNTDTGNKLNEVWHFSYRKFQYETGQYLSFTNYQEFTPNIVCFTKCVEFDNAGNPVVKSDESFSHLNNITELVIESSQKLLGLGTKQINNLLSTKFFKRKFLNENKIRFNVNAPQDNIELLFLTTAFLTAENIVFVPQFFSGAFK